SLFIFFYVDLPLCVLHSFPTRRSSDLDCADCLGSSVSVAYDGPISVPSFGKTLASGCDWSGRLAGVATDTERNMPLRSLYCGLTDRKSTRLNSSHLGISYAVFCLKKKK